MYIETIETTGLKHQDASYTLGPCNVLIGENGAGKTRVIDALYLLTFGRGSSPDLPKTKDGVMRLARGNELKVRATVIRDDGSKAVITRTWKRSLKGKTTEALELEGMPELRARTNAERQAFVSGWLGRVLEAWRPADLLTLSPAKLRKRLLDLLPQADFSLEKVVPKDVPAWAKPDSDDMPPLDWAHTALVRSEAKVAELHADRRETEAVLEELAGAPAGESIEPLQSRLKGIRQRVGESRASLMAARVVKDTEAELKRLREKPVTGGPVDRLIGSVVLCAVEETRIERKRLTARYSAVSDKAAALVNKIDRLERHGITETKRTASDIAQAKEDMITEHNTAELKRVELEADLRAAERVQVGTCPHCKADLAEYWRRETAQIEEDLRAVETLRAELAMQVARLGDEERAIEHVDLSARYKACLDEKARAKQALDALPSEDTCWQVAPAAQLSVSAAMDAETTQENIEALELDLEIARANFEGYDVEDLDALETEAVALEGRIEEIGRANAHADQLKETKAHLEWLEAELETMKGWRSSFSGILTGLLGTACGWLEKRLSTLTGQPVAVELVDARGGETCRLTVAGVDVLTLAAGERFRFLAALAGSVCEAVPDAEFRPIVLDGFEQVSFENRKPFLAELLTTVSAGTASQVFIAGCPDSIPVLDGLTVIDAGDGPHPLEAVAS